jgi:pimeloyl-ACP methyl ester carboxylesterase
MDAARRHPLAPILAGLDQPVLLVRGRHDRIAPRSWLDDLVSRRAVIEAVTLPGGGHMVPITHPHDLASAIAPFLARHTTPSS